MHHQPRTLEELERELGQRYQIVRALGRGAFGAVYLARERQLHRLVAIKVLRQEIAASDEERSRLLREARTVANLSHPAIVPLFTFGETGRTVYMVTPYIGGETLAERIERGDRFESDEVRRIMIEIADALAYAHGEGVLHRDLKPENILLERAGAVGDDVPPRVRLIDFGVAAFPMRDAGVGATYELWGTPHFMAPEQLFGEPELDPRSELYSLGVLGFLLLGGRLPFDAASVTERLTQQRQGPAMPLAVCAPHAPDDLVSAIERCLAFEPEQRWARARDVRDALVRGAASMSETGTPLSIVRQRLRARRRPHAPAPVPRVPSPSSVPAAFAGMGADARFAIRALRRTPGFTAAIILTLALGLGATTAMFSAVEALVLRALPVADPASLVTIQEQRSGPNQLTNIGITAVGYERYLAYRDAMTNVFAGVAGHATESFALRVGNEPRMVTGFLTSLNYFDVLGIQPAFGRFYGGGAERSGPGDPVVVLGYDVWRTAFGGNPNVIGRTVTIDSRPLTVVAVAPRGFQGVFGGLFTTDVWVPVRALRSPPPGASAQWRPNDSWVSVFGRLRPGSTASQANAALRVVSPRLPTEDPRTRIRDAWVEPMTVVPGTMYRQVASFTTMLLAVAGLVLLIAATNAAGMLLARAAVRRREVATRLAMGATRGRVARQLLVESLLLCTAAGAVGVLLAFYLARLVNGWELPLPVRVDAGFGINARVLAGTAITVLGAALLAGLAPALQGTRIDLAQAMKDGGLQSGPRRTRLRSTFVVVQVALSMVLLVVAGLFTQALQRALRVDPGFDTTAMITASASPWSHGYDRDRSLALITQWLERLRSRQEIAGASVAYAAPLSGNNQSWGARRLDRPNDDETPARWGVADAGFLELLGVSMVAGRTFTPADGPGAPKVAVINQTMAERLWPELRPPQVLGRELTIAAEQLTVVGVMRNGKYGELDERPRAFAFLAFAQRVAPPTLYVRARSDPQAAVRAMRAELAAIDPNIALDNVRLVTDDVSRQLLPQRLGALFVGVLGLVGLLLAMTGLYGVLAYLVAQRMREFGVRTALGARAVDIVRLVLRQGLGLAVAGIALGLAGGIAAGRLVSGFLFGVSPADPLAMLSVIVVLAFVAVLACVIPARRAAAADPMTSLRAE